MRLQISLCKCCRLDPIDCEHQKQLRAVTRKIKSLGVLVHHCPIYYDQVPEGTRVRLMLYQVDERQEAIEDGGTIYHEWEEVEEVTGVVVGRSFKKGLLSIKLDEPYSLNLPEPNGNWDTAHEQTVTHRAKFANDLTIMK